METDQATQALHRVFSCFPGLAQRPGKAWRFRRWQGPSKTTNGHSALVCEKLEKEGRVATDAPACFVVGGRLEELSFQSGFSSAK